MELKNELGAETAVTPGRFIALFRRYSPRPAPASLVPPRTLEDRRSRLDEYFMSVGVRRWFSAWGGGGAGSMGEMEVGALSGEV